MSRYKRRMALPTLLLRIALVTGLLVCAGGISWYALHASNSKRASDSARDAQTQCLAKISGVTTVLVDRTDPMTDAQLESLRAVFASIRKGMRKEGRLAVYPIDAEPSAVPQTLLEICAPVTEFDASALSDNLRKIKLRFDANFGRPLEDFLLALKANKVEQQSPVLEILQTVSTSPLAFDVSAGPPQREMILFSDMLQHSRALSLYRLPPEAITAHLLRRDEVRQLLKQTRLEGYGVKVYMLQRCGYAQQQRLAREFWEQALHQAGAQQVSFPPMPTPQAPCTNLHKTGLPPPVDMPPPRDRQTKAPSSPVGATSGAVTTSPGDRGGRPHDQGLAPAAPPPAATTSAPARDTVKPTETVLAQPAPAKPAARVEVTATAGAPGDACGRRVLLAREACLRTECEKPQWKHHPQCQRRSWSSGQLPGSETN